MRTFRSCATLSTRSFCHTVIIVSRQSLLLALAAIIAFGGCLWGSFHFDDYSMFSRDLWRPLETRPLTYLTFWMNAKLGGQNPFGYHAVNFALKHPDIVTHCVSMSGAFDIHQFLDGYYDNDCYFNNPPDFVPNLSDDWFLSRYRKMKIVLASGEWDMCLDQNVKMSHLLNGKSVPHWLDVWGDHTSHDWPFWQRMVGKYF